MQTSTPPARRSRALHVYAVLCALTGFSGMALSLWAPPSVMAARLEIAALTPGAGDLSHRRTGISGTHMRGLPNSPKQAFSGPILVSADAR